MGWRDRDWAKLNDEERRALFGGGRPGQVPPSSEGLPRARPGKVRKPISRRRLHAGNWALALLAVAGIASVASKYVPPSHRSATLIPQVTKPFSGTVWPIAPATPITKLAAIPGIDPGGTFTVVWRRSDLVPARRAGALCVVADGPGKVCARYAAGERPADVLTRWIQRLGYPVRNG